MHSENRQSGVVRPADAVLMPRSGGWAYPIPERPQSGEEAVAPSRLIGLVRRRKWTVAGVTALGFLIGLAATMVKAPVYRGRTSLQLEGFNDSFLRDVAPISPLLANASAENYVRNQLNVLQSDKLAQRVADKLAIRPAVRSSRLSLSARVKEIGIRVGLIPRTPPTAEQQRIGEVRGAMKARMIPQSHIIEVSYDSSDPEMAARAANTIATEFISLNREARWQLVQDTTEWLTKQTAELKARLEAGTRKLQEYAKASGLVFTNGQQTLAQDRMRQIQESLARAEGDRAGKQSRYEAALSQPADSLPDLLVAGPLRQYQTDLQTLRRQLAELKAMYTPAHYKVSRVEAQIAELESAIAKERQAIIERLKTEYDAAARLERMLANTTQSQLIQLQAAAEKESEYNVLRREVESTQQLYETMLQKTKEAGMASALRATNIRIIDPAGVPALPYSPNLFLNLATGVVFGMMGGVGVALFRERSGVVRQPGDAIALNLPELGVIPSVKDDRTLAFPKRALLTCWSADSEVALMSWKKNNSLISESFRAALASILLTSGLHDRGRPEAAGQGLVLVVSSSQAMEGKTTVLTNLGIAVAETQARVLLIDADLRKPHLHKIFDIPNDWGVSDLVRNDGIESVGVEHLARPTSVQNVWVLPTGPDSDGIGKLLYSAALKALIRRFRTDFDLILIDTPPMTLYSDARVLGRLSDGVVLVVRANRARTDALRSICMRLSQDNIPVLGTILNDWRMDSNHSRTYGSYDRYSRRANGS